MGSSTKVHRYQKIQFCTRKFLFSHKHFFSNRLNSVEGSMSFVLSLRLFPILRKDALLARLRKRALTTSSTSFKSGSQ